MIKFEAQKLLFDMKLSKEEVLKIAQDFIKDKSKTNYSFGEPRFEPHGSKGSKEPVDSWSVPMEFMLFGLGVTHFLQVEDSTGNIMYMITPHGYNYINGKPNPEPEDEGEDWGD